MLFLDQSSRVKVWPQLYLRRFWKVPRLVNVILVKSSDNNIKVFYSRKKVKVEWHVWLCQLILRGSAKSYHFKNYSGQLVILSTFRQDLICYFLLNYEIKFIFIIMFLTFFFIFSLLGFLTQTMNRMESYCSEMLLQMFITAEFSLQGRFKSRILDFQ